MFGTAGVNYFNDGSGNLEHAFISFDLPDPISPMPPFTEEEEIGPHLVFNFPSLPPRPDAVLAVLDRFVASASPVSFFVQYGTPELTIAGDWADADYNAASGRITFTAQLALQGGPTAHAVGISRVNYQVSFLAGPTPRG